MTQPIQQQFNARQKKNYSLPDTGIASSWVKIGSLSTIQGGYVTTMIINNSDGHDGVEERIQTMELIFTTSNNSDGRVLDNDQGSGLHEGFRGVTIAGQKPVDSRVFVDSLGKARIEKKVHLNFDIKCIIKMAHQN